MDKVITLAHGNGGRLMHELIESLRRHFSNKILDEMCDAAELQIAKTRLAFTTDSYVVKPLFFPGGDIGKLAVCGTVNDLSMKGAVPLFLSLALVIEEGFSFAELEKIALSIKKEAAGAKVTIVTGDVKVVERGAVDKLFINTAGIGLIKYPGRIGAKVRPGEVIIINGGIAEHGMAILNARENLKFSANIKSDCRSLNSEAQKCLAASPRISVMRDLTRGGLATIVNEIAQASRVSIILDEQAIPIKPAVAKLCDILGFDPLYVANEGKFIAFVPEKDAGKVRRALGKAARIIGEVVPRRGAPVSLKTKIGTERILPLLEDDQLPRIC
ncbi:MAG: hydrogenase expression/formation protein HypE [Candidatus Omnitrophota bacterium]